MQVLKPLNSYFMAKNHVPSEDCFAQMVTLQSCRPHEVATETSNRECRDFVVH